MLLSSVRLAKRYLSLFPVSPPKYITDRQPLARAQMEYDDESSDSGFHNLFELNLEGKDVLDIGCGYGGRTVWYKQAGAHSVIGVEIAETMVQEAREFAQFKNSTITVLTGVGEALPLPDSSVDVITSYDVFEHVESLSKTLAECYRVLRPSGTLYAVFPPFFHPTGGSHLHGYISNAPLPNLLFSCKSLCRAIDEILLESGTTFRPMRRPSDALPTVNGTTIRKFSRMLETVPFSRKSVELDPLESQRFGWLNFLPKLGTGIPLLREICTSRIVCQLTK